MWASHRGHLEVAQYLCEVGGKDLLMMTTTTVSAHMSVHDIYKDMHIWLLPADMHRIAGVLSCRHQAQWIHADMKVCISHSMHVVVRIRRSIVYMDSLTRLLEYQHTHSVHV